MRFSPQFLDEIRDRIPIADVVARKVTWDKRKSQPSRGDYWACCPFHGEKTPSFHADNRRGRYHCFGCGVSGDHFTFLVEQEGVPFPEAVELLAGEAGIPMPARDKDAEQREKVRTSLYDVMDIAAKYFEQELQSAGGAAARAYLRDRGLTPDIQKRFGIGYAPDLRNGLKQYLTEAKVEPAQMVEAGLLIAGEDIPVSYDRFRGRVMFPITDLRGRVIAFGGRALSADVPAKYLNSPETPLFHKSHVLFNGQSARTASRKGGHVVAVEGYTDVISCVAAGLEATVAPLGTALTEGQLRLLWQMSDEPILCFDGDEAGLKAAFRAVDLALPMLEPDKSVRFALLPEGRDPDDVIRADGVAVFSGYLDAARPLFEMMWRRASESGQFDTPERRAGLEKQVRETVGQITDGSVRHHYEAEARVRMASFFGRGAPNSGAGRAGRSKYGNSGFGNAGGRWPGKGGGNTSRYTSRNNYRDGPAAPAVPSASLLSNRLVRASGQAASGDINIQDAILVGGLLAHPALAEERLEKLAECRFSGRDLTLFAQVLGAAIAQAPDSGHGDLMAWLEQTGDGPIAANILARLRDCGVQDMEPGGDISRAAAIWDDAWHLRLSATTLSNDKKAAAQALGDDASDIDIDRLRDIQEQGRQHGPGPGDLNAQGADQGIVHPFKPARQ